MKKLILAILLTTTLIVAQNKNEAEKDSTQLANLQQQKQKLIEFIVQKQSDIYEAQEQLKQAYNQLSQLNIAIQLYEEKIKLYKEVKKDERK